MTNALPISRLIQVGVVLTPQAAQMQNLSTLLILGTSSIIDTTQRVRTYTSLTEVVGDFGTTAAEYLAASLYFDQTPQPTQLMIGRWALTAAAGQLIGAPLSAAQQLITTWAAVTSGSFYATVDGVPYALTGVALNAVTNLNGVATAVQVALRAAGATGAVVVWNATYAQFQVTSGTTGALSAVGFLAPPTPLGHVVFSGQPTATDTLVIDGTSIEFVSGTPSGSQVQIGAGLGTTLANLLTFLAASTDVNLVKMTYTVVGSTLYITSKLTGTTGDAYTLTASCSVATLSGSTLAGGTGTDISGMLGLQSTSSGAYVAPGVAAETALAAVALMDANFSQQWYGLTILGAADADHLAVAGYIEGANAKHLYGVTTQEAGVLVGSDTADVAYALAELKYNHTFVQYSSSNPYAACSLFGRALTVDYNGNSTTITLMYKQEPGIVAETLNTNQIAALEAKNCNVFVNYNNNTAIIEPGMVCSGQFIDTITDTDWLAVDIMTSVYNLLYTSPTKVPQTDPGTHLLVTVIESVLSQAVINGTLAPGQWNSAGFGTLSEFDYLPKGFYVYAPPVATQNPSDRAARKSVPIQVAAKLAGAIHDVAITVTVNQ